MIKNILGIAALTAMMMSCSSKGTYTCECETLNTSTYTDNWSSSSPKTVTSVNTGKVKTIMTEVSKLTAEKACASYEETRTDVNSKTGIEIPGQTPTPSKRTCTLTSN